MPRPLDLAEIAQWLRALDKLKLSDPVGANLILRDLADPLNTIHEYIEIVSRAPEHLCTPTETAWRRTHAQLHMNSTWDTP